MGFCSAADCRLTVYETVDLAKKFWYVLIIYNSPFGLYAFGTHRIKGNNFTIPNLLNVSSTSSKATAFQGGSLAIFRLAPSDYHRFHSPLDGIVGDVEHVPGQYYTGQVLFPVGLGRVLHKYLYLLFSPSYGNLLTQPLTSLVNPQAVNEPGFDVLTTNSRSILYLTHTQSGLRVAFVVIGALLVGSIKWTTGSQKGTTVKRGDELGFVTVYRLAGAVRTDNKWLVCDFRYFAYGGSTVVVIFPKGMIKYVALLH
jgi:phosphatidylserine decarboxylase